jgi:hypothetical protein
LGISWSKLVGTGSELRIFLVEFEVPTLSGLLV